MRAGREVRNCGPVDDLFSVLSLAILGHKLCTALDTQTRPVLFCWCPSHLEQLLASKCCQASRRRILWDVHPDGHRT